MKLKDALNLNEAINPSTYEDWVDLLMKSIQAKNFIEFKKIIDYAISRKKYDWFVRYYQTNDKDGTMTKALFKQATPF